jgi:hypothetical protein
MLETVREFGRMQLVDSGEDAQARDAQRRWATAYARLHGARLAHTEQLAAIDTISAEEVNLTDELRGSMTDGDIDGLVQLLSALGTFWALRGEHARLIALAGSVANAVRDWSPPAELEDVTRAAMSVLLSNAVIVGDERIGPIRALLQRLGPGDQPGIAGFAKVMLAFDPVQGGESLRRVEQLARDPDPNTAVPAYHWLCHVRENAGDPAGAIEAAERALSLIGDEEGPWHGAMLRSQLAELTMHMGHPAAALEHALAALPVMHRLGAADDEVQLRSLLSFCAIWEQRLEDAEDELERIERIDGSKMVFGGAAFGQIGRAELALVRGDHVTGLRIYRECAAGMREMQFPGIPRTGLEPWAMFGDSAALTAHAHYARSGDEPHGRDLFEICRDHARRALSAADVHLDYPVVGLLLFGLGAWALLRGAAPADDAARLLALADSFAYNRAIPTMAWERLADHVEESVPGRLATLREEYRDRRPPDLLEEAGRAVERLPEG